MVRFVSQSGALVFLLSVENLNPAPRDALQPTQNISNTVVTITIPEFATYNTGLSDSRWRTLSNEIPTDIPCPDGYPSGQICAIALGDLPPGAGESNIRLAVNVVGVTVSNTPINLMAGAYGDNVLSDNVVVESGTMVEVILPGDTGMPEAESAADLRYYFFPWVLK